MMNKKVDSGQWTVDRKLQNPKQSRGFTSASEGENESPFSFFRSAAEAKAPRAFTLLLAVLVSGILLALGLAISNIVIKDLVLSSSGRESQFAFYAADTGVECALYWDIKHDAFSPESTITEFYCGDEGEGKVPLTSNYNAGLDILTTTFSLALGPAEANACSSVSVQKYIAQRKTVVEALGYNTCNLTNPRRIERAIRVQY